MCFLSLCYTIITVAFVQRRRLTTQSARVFCTWTPVDLRLLSASHTGKGHREGEAAGGESAPGELEMIVKP